MMPEPSASAAMPVYGPAIGMFQTKPTPVFLSLTRRAPFAQITFLPSLLSWTYGVRPFGSGGCGDATIKLWDVKSGEEVGVLRGHTAAIGSVEFSPDGNRLISASQDQTIKIWDATPLPEKP